MMGRWGQRLVWTGLACATLAAGLMAADRLLPPDLSRLAAPSRAVLARDGSMLRAFLAPDRQWRLATTPAGVSPAYLELLLDVEDKRFWTHRGVDPLSLARAAGQLVSHGHIVSGGSTLTMQVARLLDPRPRGFGAKLIQIARALQLEERLSKQEILAAYLTLTPMGGNLQGLRAGALAWFGKEPYNLTEPEAALLVALPQAPRAVRPDAPGNRAAAARAKILNLARRDGLIGAAAYADAVLAPLPTRRRPLPVLAPHLAEELVAQASGPLRTSLDRDLQQGLQRRLRQTLDDIPRPVNLAAIIADWRTGEVRAEAGSGDYFDDTRRGAIDMTRAIRSPGSTLKPFIYGMAFERLLAHPGSLVRDEPTRFDDYAPHNFNGGFNGDVTVRQALQASLNLPAVLVLQRLGPVAFTSQFKQAGLPLTFDNATSAPSLPLALGGVGFTLRDLVTAYAALADSGAVKPLNEIDAASSPGPREALLSAAAADAVTDILSGMPPPKGAANHAAAIAYKTGTSYRFRDGWAVGFDGGHVIGVWMGRADGGPCQGCVGAAAAGILFRLFDLLAPNPLPKRALTPGFAGPPPPGLVRLANPATGTGVSAPHITFPLTGSKLLADHLGPEGDQIKLIADGGQRPYHWLVDGRPVPSPVYACEAAWRPQEEGFSTVTVIDATGQADEVKVRVQRRAVTE